MTSSSSLYGTVNTQNASSTNSTSLYGGADTPIPTPTGDLIVRGDLWVLSGNVLTTAQTGNLFPANATTVNLGNAATTVNIGADTGTTTINNNLTVDGDVTAEGGTFGNVSVGVVNNNTINNAVGALTLSSGVNSIVLDSEYISNPNPNAYLFNSPTTVVAFDSATSLTFGETTGTTTIRNDLVVQGSVTAEGADFGNITIAVADDNTITTTSGNLKLSAATGDIGLIGADTLYTDNTGTFNLLNAPTTIYAFDSATTLELGDSAGGGATRVRNDLTVNGDTITIAQGTDILYSEANDRTNRPTVRSTTGNSSGFRVEAPNATTSAASSISAFSTNDVDNGKFINISARGTTSNDLRIQTGKYTAGVLGASGTVVSFVDNITAYATVNPAGPTDPSDLTTKTYVDSLFGTIPTYDTNVAPTAGGVELDLRAVYLGYTIVGSTKFLGGTNITISETAPNEITIDGTDLNTTYTQNASTTTGGANLNLVGSDATTDTIKFANGTNVTITATDANTITISAPDTNTTYTIDASATTGGANLNLVGSDASTDTIKFSGAGATTVTQTSANEITITSTDADTTYTQNVSATTGGANLNLVGSDATTDTVKFANGTGVTVAETDANTMTVSIGQAVGTSDSVTFADVTLDSLVNLNTATLTTSTTAANQVADSFVAATYRTCKYVIQATSGSAYQAVEALLVHDGSTAYINTYSDVRTGANLTSIGAAVNGANIELQVTPVNAVTTYKISKTLITV